MNLVYLFKAGSAIGIGHMSRALSFGRSAKKNSIKCTLVYFGKSQANEREKMKKFAETFSQEFVFIESHENIVKLTHHLDSCIVLIDFPNNFYSEDLGLLTKLKRKSKIVTIDDVTERRLISDVNFYPPLTWLKELDWPGYEGQIKSGWEYYIMRPELEEYRENSASIKHDFLVTCGGSDSQNLSKKLTSLIRHHWPSSRIAVILGPLADSKKSYLGEGIETFVNPKRYLDLINRSRNIICTYGVTLFELAYLRKRTYFICLNKDHVKSSQMFLSLPNFQRIGTLDKINQKDLVDCFDKSHRSLNGLSNEMVFEEPLNSKIFSCLKELGNA